MNVLGFVFMVMIVNVDKKHCQMAKGGLGQKTHCLVGVVKHSQKGDVLCWFYVWTWNHMGFLCNIL